LVDYRLHREQHYGMRNPASGAVATAGAEASSPPFRSRKPLLDGNGSRYCADDRPAAFLLGNIRKNI
jgi:hypothetical protein